MLHSIYEQAFMLMHIFGASQKSKQKNGKGKQSAGG